jgi:hypothetical protein
VSGRAELFRALGALSEPPGPTQARLAETFGLPQVRAHEHTDVFGLQLYPYASVYVGAEGMLGGEARDRAAGFWRALRLVPPAEPDHLATLLSLYASLIEADRTRADLWAPARKALLWEHLLSWLPPYLDKVAGAGAPVYERWAFLLSAAVADEATELGPQDRLPLHLRAAPDEVDEDLVVWVLAPVRSGIVAEPLGRSISAPAPASGASSCAPCWVRTPTRHSTGLRPRREAGSSATGDGSPLPVRWLASGPPEPRRPHSCSTTGGWI